MSDNSFQGAPESASNEAAAAVPEQGTVTTPESANNEASQGGDSEESQEPRVFTQEELDEIVAKRVAKAERKIRREQEQATQAPPEVPGYLTGEPPKPEDFKDALSYAEALADFKAEEKLAQREAQQQRNAAESTYADRAEAARDKYDDFDEVVQRHPNDGGPAISTAMAEVIKASEMGPELAYHLGKNPDESKRIWALPPYLQAMELGRLEAKLVANPPVKKTSSAPDPITPVRRGASISSYDPTDPRSLKMDSDAWIKARNAQVAKQNS